MDYVIFQREEDRILPANELGIADVAFVAFARGPYAPPREGVMYIYRNAISVSLPLKNFSGVGHVADKKWHRAERYDSTRFISRLKPTISPCRVVAPVLNIPSIAMLLQYSLVSVKTKEHCTRLDSKQSHGRSPDIHICIYTHIYNVRRIYIIYPHVHVFEEVEETSEDGS